MAERLAPREILVSDPGVDDAVGLLVSAALPKDKLFVATFGNAPTTQTSANFKGIEHFIRSNLRAKVPERHVYAGADKPGAETLEFIHGVNAIEGQFPEFTPSNMPSAVLYDELSEGKEKEYDVISLGALTEVSSILKSPITNKVRSLTVMGGAIHVQGNIAPRVEANIGGDPKALQEVLTAVKERDIPITIIPLDVTQLPELEFTPERVEKLVDELSRNGSINVAALISKLTGPDSQYTKFYQQKQGVFSNRQPFGPQRFQGAAMHDLTAVLVKEHPEIFSKVRMPINASENGELGIPTGWMPDFRSTECDVVMDIKNPEEYWKLTAKYLSKYS